jgi:hypothetical protein
MARGSKKFFLGLIFLAACASGSLMTRNNFDDIEIGTPVNQVVKKYGDPYLIRKQKDGTVIYRYIERYPIGSETVEENKYDLVIKNGDVVSKRYNYELPPAYDELYDEDPNDVPN